MLQLVLVGRAAIGQSSAWPVFEMIPHHMSDKQDNLPESDPKVFLDNLRNSGILEAGQREKLLQKIRNQFGPVEVSAQQLARHFVSAGLLTEWQTEKLIRGRYKGFLLGKYVLLDHLGTGGMSTVYLAEHKLTGQKRAIKVLPRKRLTERSYLSRFYREGRAVAGLNHPNIVRIYDIAGEDDTHYMVMEYVQGSDLFDVVMQNGPVDFQLARHCITQAAAGLAHAHDNKMVHRDIKPANLLLTKTNQLKVLDLGLALLKYDDNKFGLSAQNNERMLGTVDYLAPEQAINSHEVDHRADIYGLGCTLYFLLTGRPPFTEGSLAERIAMHQTVEPTPITQFRKDCPDELAALCQKMMHKSPDNRFQNCRDLIVAFETRNGARFTKNKQTKDSHQPGKAKTKAAINDHPLPTTRIKARKNSLVPIVAGLSALALSVAVLAYFVLVESKTPRPIAATNEDTVTEERTTTNGVEAANVVDRTPSFRSTERPNPDRLTNEVKLLSTSNPHLLKLDFESKTSVRKLRNKWELLSGQTIFGTLLTRRQCKIVESSDENSNSTNNVVLLRGNSSDVEFRPMVADALISTVSFNAKRQHDNPPIRFLIQAKPSIAGPEKWQTVADLSNRLQFEIFSHMEIDQESFAAIDSRKFRFNIEGSPENGVYIDDLVIKLR